MNPKNLSKSAIILVYLLRLTREVVCTESQEVTNDQALLILLSSIDSNTLLKVIIDGKSFVQDNEYVEILEKVSYILNAVNLIPTSNIRLTNISKQNSFRVNQFLDKFVLIPRLQWVTNIDLIIYIGKIEAGIYVTKEFGQSLSLHYHQDILLLLTTDDHLPFFKSIPVFRYFFSQFPLITIVLSSSMEPSRFCMFCAFDGRTKLNLHSLVHENIDTLKSMIVPQQGDTKSLTKVDGWVTFVTSDSLDEVWITEDFRGKYPLVFGFNNSDVFIPIEISLRLNMTLVNCPSMKTSWCRWMHKSVYHRYLGKPFPSFYGRLVQTSEYHETKFIVPLNVHSDMMNSLLHPLSRNITLVVGLSVITMLITFTILLMKDLQPFRTALLRTTKLLVRPLLNEAVGRLPSDTVQFKICFVTWLLFCLVIIEFYKGNLIGNLVKPSELLGPETLLQLTKSEFKFIAIAQQFKTLAELNESDHEINETVIHSDEIEQCPLVEHSNTLVILQKEYKHLKKRYIRRILEKLADCNSMVHSRIEAYKRIIASQTEVLLTDADTSAVFSKAASKSSKNTKFHVSRESIKNYLYYGVSEDFYSQRITEFFRNIQSSGLWQIHLESTKKVNSMKIHRLIKANTKRPRKKHNNHHAGPNSRSKHEFLAMKYDNLKGMFVAILFCLGISSLSFICELCTNTHCKNTMFRKPNNTMTPPSLHFYARSEIIVRPIIVVSNEKLKLLVQ